MSDHLDERIPRGDASPAPGPFGPIGEQPEAKPYPTRDDPRFCPFAYASPSGPPGETSWTRPPCDPAGCQLGLEDPGCCALINIAATLDTIALNLIDKQSAAEQLSQLVKQLSDRLGANLQSIHSNQTRLTDLARSIDETPFLDSLTAIQRTLLELSVQLAHVLQKLAKDETP